MKSYTDINQSKKLAEILPIESADMYYGKYDIEHANTLYVSCDIQHFNFYEHTPCWSLSALLNVIPEEVRLVGNSKQSYWYCECIDSNVKSYLGESADNPVDACYNLILRLNKLRIL